MNNYFSYTDLIDESAFFIKNDKNAKLISKKQVDNILITYVKVTTDFQSKQLSRDKGIYITIDCEKVDNKKDVLKLKNTISYELQNIIKSKINNDIKLLVVGLGNKNISADSIGSLVVEKLNTNSDNIKTKIYAISTGVYGMTGIESLDIVRGVANEVGANIVLCIDTLATTKLSRIYNSFQITDTGIIPGSALKSGREKINEQSVGVPVIAIGVPICIYARSLCEDSINFLLKNDDITKHQKLKLYQNVLGQKNINAILCLKDVEYGVEFCGDVLTYAINKCF